MFEHRSGEELFSRIRELKVVERQQNALMAFTARCELLNGQQHETTTDLAKFAVAMWGMDAPEMVKPLYDSSSRLVDVAGQPVVHRNFRRNHLVELNRINGKKYADSENRTSWRVIIAGDYQTETGETYFNRQYDDWRPLPNFSGELVAITDIGTDMAEGRAVLWAGNGFTGRENNSPPPKVTEFAIGFKEIVLSEFVHSFSIADILSEMYELKPIDQ